MPENMTTGRFVEPSMVVTHLHLHPGDKVVDLGAGKGYYTKVLSQAVTEEGVVYACEIQKNLLDTLSDMARTEHLSNVEPVWCDLEEIGGTKLADNSIDSAILINTLFQLEDRSTTIQEAWRILRSGGKFFVVDWSESFGGLGPQSGQVIDETEAKDLCEAEGFVLERNFDAGEHHYGLAFRKP